MFDTDDELLEELATPADHNLHDSLLGIPGRSHLVPGNHFLSYGGRVGPRERLMIFHDDNHEPALIGVIEE